MTKGVTKTKTGYVARAHVDGKQRYLGTFTTAEAASVAYQRTIANTRIKKPPVPIAQKPKRIPSASITRQQINISTQESKVLLLQQHLQQNYTYRNGELYRNSTGKKLGTCHRGYMIASLGAVYSPTKLVSRLIYAYHYGVLPVEIDHIDGNRMNNRIENLRPATRSQNAANSKLSKANTTGYKGVSKSLSRVKYTAQIGYAGKDWYIGTFATAEQAAIAYNQKAIELFGQFARINIL